MFFASLPWHPFWVHFPIALWLVGAATLGIGLIPRFKSIQKSAWIMLTIAAITSIPSALSGQNALDALGDIQDPVLSQHERLGNLLPWLMSAVILFKGHTFFSKKSSLHIPDFIWFLLAFAITLLALYVGHIGGILVYEKKLLYA